MEKGYIYIMPNKNNSILYIGVTSDVTKRILQHKSKSFPNSFTAKYNCNKLVFFQEFSSIIEAIAEEKRLKGGNRNKKIGLINEQNPKWVDLAKDWIF